MKKLTTGSLRDRTSGASCPTDSAISPARSHYEKLVTVRVGFGSRCANRPFIKGA